MTDTLAQQLSDDLETSFPSLVDSYGSMVLTLATRLTDQATGEDIAQEVFLRAYRALRNYDETQCSNLDLRPWLATITRNRVKDFFKKRERHPRGVGGTEALQQFQNVPDHDSTSDQELEKSISLASLDRRIPIRLLEIVKAECDPKTWQAFWLTTVMHDSAADVAARLEMQVGNVYQAKSRILARLRKRIEELP